LLTDDDGNPVEPLAADVRGSDRRERNKKFKTEILRLAAPIIGCTYDDLKQRHRERIIRRTIAIVSSAAAVIAIAGTAFGIYNARVAAKMKLLADEKAALADEKAALADEKTRLAEEISVQYEGKLENQSRFYSEEALSLLTSGNREDAVLVAMEGLPADQNDRPYVAEAEYALSRSLYAYDTASSMTYDRILAHDLSISEMRASEDKRWLIVKDNGSKVYVWDTKDWSLRCAIDPAIDDSNLYVVVTGADADDTGIYITTKQRLIKYNFDGGVLYWKDFDDTVRDCNSCGDTGKLVVVCDSALYVLNTADGKVLSTHADAGGQSLQPGGKYDQDSGLFVTSNYDSDVTSTYLSVYDVKKDEYREMTLSEGHYLDSCLTPDGNIAAVSCNDGILEANVHHVVTDLFSPDGKRLWTSELAAHIRYPMSFCTNVKAHKYLSEDAEHKDIVIAIESEAFTLNEENGQTVAAFTLPGEATALSVVLSNSLGRVGYRQGNFDIVDFADGKIYSEHTFYTEGSIRDWVILGDKIAYNSTLSTEVYVVSWHSAPDLEDYHTFDTPVLPSAVSPDGSYFAMSPTSDYHSIIFMDADGKELYRYQGEKLVNDVRLFRDKACLIDGNGLTVIDPRAKKEALIRPSDLGFSEFLFETALNRDGSKCVFWTSNQIMLFDVDKKEVIGTYEVEGDIGKIILSDDGSRLYLTRGKENLIGLDTATGDPVEFHDDQLRTVAEDFYKDYMTVSPDGRYLAICCMDGLLRVVDTQTFETFAQAPLQSYLRSYITFTDDGSHIVVQGDDYRIRIFDMETQSYINYLDGSASVDFIVCDEESGLMAVCSGYDLFLFETGSYGCVAYADAGIVYLKGDDSILLCSDKTEVKRTRYKDYRKLIEEAAKQFPGAALSDEKRAKYNIN
ncbi:MAG: WD40 repeat domain-containing protein, partial [Lachnospiraceae bacterium]|nr:WD40 repeat domain-containing protein [Lachnospiraceae bacterium]